MPWPIIGAIGGLLGGLGSIGGTIGGLINAGKASPQMKFEKGQWERMREPAVRSFSNLFYTPSIAGQRAPYSQNSGQPYSWAPSPALQNLYSYYLGRQYGLPESIARAQSAQAMGPVRLPNIGEISTAGQAAKATAAPPASQLAEALLNSRAPAVNRQLDLLKSATDIAAFNLYRAQLLPQMIG